MPEPTQNLVQNGGFELPVLVGQQPRLFETGQQIGGWFVVGSFGDVAVLDTTFEQGGQRFNAHEGFQSLDLTGLTNTAAGVAQVFATSAGARYQLSFYLGNANAPGDIWGVRSGIAVEVDGRALDVARVEGGPGGVIGWTKFSYEFTATGPATQLGFYNLDGPTDNLNQLDDVVVSALGQTLMGTDGPDNLGPADTGDTYVAGAGNDQIVPGAGNDTLDGGAGLDTAVYAGARLNYQLVHNGQGFTLTDTAGPDGSDNLVDVERLLFGTGKLALDLNGHAGQTALLLGAVLGKAALQQQALVGSVLGLFDAGSTLPQLCEVLVSSGIMAQLGAGPGNAAFVTRVVTNALGGVTPGPEPLAVLQALLDAQDLTQAQFLAVVAVHPLNQANVDLVGLAQTGLEYL